ncbi:MULTISPECIES: AraC family transcriptional regulator [Acinetobacter]|uniref:AraC family transcriptional regulator n=1 Tax=Acinetobacter TaxID=469 RepID=UPI001A12CDCC|nr:MULTISPECIES: AraC family transcriptional regulator [Acinetobacter]MCU4388164.1 AraC family transcriptional regulator [Acinetobacter haemolyticus]HIQ35570.1 AraC family transcriptional regulator [Acinetobacter venetianus]HJP46362.1 AraC family transcriptional regulator [Acinetobacter venetianus]
MASYIRAASLGGFEELVRNYGINPIAILKQVGIMPALLRNPDSFINYEHYLSLLELASQTCREECFGLKLGALQNISTIGLIGVYMSRQETILDALKVAQKYVYLHAEGIVFHVSQVNSELCKLTFVRLSDYNIEVPQKSQLAICVITNILKDLIGPIWYAEKVYLKQHAPKQSKIFSEHFSCEVKFSTDEDALYFPASFLANKPYAFNENLVNQLILNQLESLSSTKIDDTTILIESSVSMLLATGDCNIENTSLCVGMHPKKIQRFLKTKGTTFRDIIESVRKKEAIRMLEEGDMKLTDIALQLGYSELAIFSRNFKQWFGLPATEFKEKLKEHSE